MAVAQSLDRYILYFLLTGDYKHWNPHCKAAIASPNITTVYQTYEKPALYWFNNLEHLSVCETALREYCSRLLYNKIIKVYLISTQH